MFGFVIATAARLAVQGLSRSFTRLQPEPKTVARMKEDEDKFQYSIDGPTFAKDKVILSKARDALGLDQCKVFIVGGPGASEVLSFEHYRATKLCIASPQLDDVKLSTRAKQAMLATDVSSFLTRTLH